MSERKSIPNLGIGIGLRPVHYGEIFNSWPPIDWFEIISENFLRAGPAAMGNLERILERYPVVMHGVSLSIGGTAPLDLGYLALDAGKRGDCGGDHRGGELCRPPSGL